ncbi:uncharacterized protein [Triticum aestivum]|uniref:uncharacterized protein n=1 Tax=Triticum aestivum TaxID=4565 RepID=UPI001D01DF0F|nr:uncharacterized protein LOC123102863 [Triticum aestivum]
MSPHPWNKTSRLSLLGSKEKGGAGESGGGADADREELGDGEGPERAISPSQQQICDPLLPSPARARRPHQPTPVALPNVSMPASFTASQLQQDPAWGSIVKTKCINHYGP